MRWENPTTGERVVKVGLLRFMLIRVNETDDMEAVLSLLYERFCAFQRMECEKDFTQSKLQMARAGARIVWSQLYRYTRIFLLEPRRKHVCRARCAT